MSEVRPGVIYDWKTIMGIICEKLEKVCFESGVRERKVDR